MLCRHCLHIEIKREWVTGMLYAPRLDLQLSAFYVFGFGLFCFDAWLSFSRFFILLLLLLLLLLLRFFIIILFDFLIYISSSRAQYIIFFPASTTARSQTGPERWRKSPSLI